jgi:hypothetical protein
MHALARPVQRPERRKAVAKIVASKAHVSETATSPGFDDTDREHRAEFKRFR